MIEQIKKRARNSKTHDLGNNKFSLDCSIGSVHYQDAQAGWQNIDNEFLPVALPWKWEMLKAGYHIRVKEDFTAGQIIEFEKQGETVQFQPMALEWTNDLDQIQQVSMPQNIVPVITNAEVDLLPNVGVPSKQGTIRWNDAYGNGIDFEWKCTPSRLVKILHIDNLSSLPIPQQYIIDGGNPVLRFNLIFDPSNGTDIFVDGAEWNKRTKKQTFNVIEFRKNGEILWVFDPLKYWDSSDEDNQGQSVATLEKGGNKLYISIRVPYSWLQAATYPVFIDADVDETIAATEDDTYRYVTFWVNNVNPRLGDYGDGGGGDRAGSWRYASVTIPDGATISVAYLTLTSSSNASGTVCNLLIMADDSATPIAPVDHASFVAKVRTTAQPAWNGVGAWTTNSTYNTPSLVSVVEELMASFSYAGGAAMQFIIEPNGCDALAHRRPYDYTSDSTKVTTLHIEYSAGGAPAFTAAKRTIGVM